MKKVVVGIAVIVVLVLTGIGAWYSFNSTKTYAAETGSISIGTSPQELSGLIYIAVGRGYFVANGLNVTIKDYDSGSAAVDGMLNDEVNMSGTIEYVIVNNAFKGKNISSIGYISRGQSIYLIGRTDHGISNISDLKGKKIGVTRNTASEFYLGRFLSLHGIDMRYVDLVDVKGSQSEDAIINGDVDAVITWQPYVNMAQDRLGNSIVIWQAQSGQPSYWNIVGKDDWIAAHPKLVNKFLKSIVMAEEFNNAHPDEAMAIVQKKLNYTDTYMAAVWPDYQFSLGLDQSLLIAMNDEGRWMINNNLTNEKTLPYFRDYIYTKALEEVKPEAVNIR